ncbi:unnamed protein product [Cylindrotheca closterium]|uniref:Uncharacterized protein n=1 Tax=Cylindrotheca closterium TaxID=2856 RepID=A0AAD2FED0_9STRA|nr:unnamed protein product [Cylindrotheca closterium]
MNISEHAKKHGTVYQIQCETQNKGKRVASSKRRIRWRFGFANLQAGKTGKDCRGAEHEVVFVWSLNSGKQLILADGHEVHWAKIGRKEKLEVDWNMSNGNHKLKVVAEPSVKSRKSTDSRQFDLLIDGISFSDLPSIYQLGTDAAGSSRTSTAVRSSGKPVLRQESRSYSMPDLLSLPQQHTPPPQKTMQQQSPTSSIDMTVFDNGVGGVEVQFQQPPLPPQQHQCQRSQSATTLPQTQPLPQQQNQQHQYQRSHSVSSPQRSQATAAAAASYNYSWNDATAMVPTPQQAYHSRNSWQPPTAHQQQQQPQIYNWNDAASPQKRGSIGSYASSSNASSNPFLTPQKSLSGYSTPTSSVNPGYDSDLNDSPLSQALKSLGLDTSAHNTSCSVQDDHSVTSHLSVTSNPFDFVQPSVQTYLPTLMIPQVQQPQPNAQW